MSIYKFYYSSKNPFVSGLFFFKCYNYIVYRWFYVIRFFLYFYHIHVMTPHIHFAIVTKNDLTTCWYDEHVWVKLNLFQHCPESNYYRFIICTQIASNEGSKSLNRYHKQIHVVLSSIWGQFHTTILKHIVLFPTVFFIDLFTLKTKCSQNPQNQGPSVKLNFHLILRIAAKFCVSSAMNAVPLSDKIIWGQPNKHSCSF